MLGSHADSRILLARRFCLALALGLAAAAGPGSALFGEEPYQPLKLVFGAKGVDGAETQIAVTGELYKIEAVEEAAVAAGKITLQVKPEQTLSFNDVEKAVRAAAEAAGGEAKPEVEFGSLVLVGACRLTLALAPTGAPPDAAVEKALRGAPNVAEVKGTGREWTVTFRGPKGAMVSEVAAALGAGLGRTPNVPAPGLEDVAWTAPKAPPKAGGHGCGGGGCGGGKGGGGAKDGEKGGDAGGAKPGDEKPGGSGGK